MKLSQLKDPLFITALLLLLLNDLVLKYSFGNWITGKLSDFCGLFIFPFFWSALFPQHIKRIHILTALGFILWKSPFSQPLFNFFHTFNFPIDRVADHSDLLALPSILFSFYRFRQERTQHFRIPAALIGMTALFSFYATTQPRMPKLDYVNLDQHYRFPIPLKELGMRVNRDLPYHVKKLMRLDPSYHYDSEKRCYMRNHWPDTLAMLINTDTIGLYDTVPVISFLAKMDLVGHGDSSELVLNEIHTWAPASTDTVEYKQDMLKTFDKLIVSRLRKN